MIDDLDALSDEVLNELFAIEVAGYKRLRYCTPGVAYLIPLIVASYFADRDESWKEAEKSDKTVWFATVFKEYAHFKEPRFITDPSEVVMWLDNLLEHVQHEIVYSNDHREHVIQLPKTPLTVARTFARAGAIALIRHRRLNAVQP